MSSKVPIHILPHGEGLSLPFYVSDGAAGMDLYAAISESINLLPMQRILIPTGIVIALPFGMEGQIRARSGLALNHGLAVLNAPGTVDSDYRGEIKVLLINLGQDSFSFERGMRIAQLVVANYCKIEWERTKHPLSDTVRGDKGFGSTGIN